MPKMIFSSIENFQEKFRSFHRTEGSESVLCIFEKNPPKHWRLPPPRAGSKKNAKQITVKLRYKAPGYNTIPLITLQFQFP